MFPVQKFESLKTPFYYYDLGLLEETLKSLTAVIKPHNYHVHYAFKANTNERMLKLIQKYGMGADCVSGGEVKRAVQLGFSADKIVFAGVGKTNDEIEYALNANILCFNCESVQEIEVINELAAKAGKTASIALRINPNVDAHTHHYITTGLEENKFGINIWELESLMKIIKGLKNIQLIGIHFHIGSQITDLSVFKSLCVKVNELQQWFKMHHVTLKHVNVGGGLGVDYHNPDKNSIPDFESYFNVFTKFLQLERGQELHFELGRALVAQSGTLISKVLYVKKGVNTNFAILDAGMTELIRPALYQSYHKIENISKLGSPYDTKYDVVGPICESSDCFGKAVSMPETQRGDIIAIRTAGAYGEVLSSNYNLREKAPVVYSDKV